MKRDTLGLLVVVLLVAASLPGRASAWSRYCAWPTGPTGTTEIPTYVWCQGFEHHGYSCSEVGNAVLAMVQPWNNTGGTRIRIDGTPATSSDAFIIPGAINFSMQGQSSDPSIMANWGGNCSGGGLVFFAHFNWSSELPIASFAQDMVGVGVHELGHGIGFLHAGDPAGACGGGALSGPSIMAGAPFGRAIYRDDWDGLRGGSCAYSAATPTGSMQVRQSMDGGATWSTLHSWSTGTNLGPGIARGGPGGGGWTEAVVNTSNRVTIWRFNGSWTGPMSDPVATNLAMAGVSVACHPTLCVAVYPLLVETGNSQGIIRVLRTTDGVTWTGVNTTVRTPYRPGIFFDGWRSRFYIAYAHMPDPTTGGSSEGGQIRVMSTADGLTFTTPFEVENWATGSYAAAGPGIACYTSRCRVLFPDANTIGNNLRQVVMATIADGSITGLTTSFSFPAWGSRWVMSHHDVGVSWDQGRSDFVYAFRELNAARSLVAGWQDVADTTPPPGWTTYPPPGFGSGGQAMSSTYGGVAVATDSTGTYTFAHQGP